MSLLFWAPLTNLHDQAALSSHPALTLAATAWPARPASSGLRALGLCLPVFFHPCRLLHQAWFSVRHPRRRDSCCQLKRCRQGRAGWREQPRKHLRLFARGVSSPLCADLLSAHSRLAFYRTSPTSLHRPVSAFPSASVCDACSCFYHPRLRIVETYVYVRCFSHVRSQGPKGKRKDYWFHFLLLCPPQGRHYFSVEFH